MKTGRLTGIIGLGATMLLVPMAWAQTSDPSTAQGSDQATGQSTQNKGTAAKATPATPSSQAGAKASTTPSRTGQKKSKRHGIRWGRRHGHKVAMPQGATTGSSGGTNGGATGTGGGTTGAGTQTGSGNASQGNLPNQQGNQTENNQNNSQNTHNTNVSAGTMLAGLVNVNVQNVNLNVYKIVDVHNVLNNSQVEVLTQKIQNSPGAVANQNVLTNLLRGAHVLNGNQIVLGLLSQQHQILYGSKAPAK